MLTPFFHPVRHFTASLGSYSFTLLEFIWPSLTNRPQSSNHQRPRKAMGGPNIPRSPFLFPTADADADGPLSHNNDPARRFARQSRMPTAQPPLHTQVYVCTEERRPHRPPARTRTTRCACSHGRSRSHSRPQGRGRGAYCLGCVVTLSTSTRRRRRGEPSEAQAQKEEEQQQQSASSGATTHINTDAASLSFDETLLAVVGILLRCTVAEQYRRLDVRRCVVV